VGGSTSGNGGNGGGGGGRSCNSGGGGRPTPPAANPVETGLELTDFATTNGTLTRQHFGTGINATTRNQIIDWVHGAGRANRLGDIYHSSPVVVGAPSEDIPDESYNEFRRRPDVVNRPKVVYVGTNDGVMHAFIAEDVTITDGPHAGTSYRAGDELWGFVPPAFFRSLNAARSGHVYTVDGTPVVKDIFFDRRPGQAADGNSYHTVMIFGLRGGGGAYLALDVTDPIRPRFLWQVAHAEMGATYGTPGVGQVLVEDSSGNIREIAMVLLPGGAGVDLSSSTCGGVPVIQPDGRLSRPLGCPSRGKGRPPANAGTLNARDNMRCWDTPGRSMYFVDPASGEVLTYLDDRVFNSPVTGGVSFFTGDVGTIATRAFVTDADGVIWRIDFSDPDPRNWDADPFHDIFWDLTATEGQPAYFPPVLTTDDQGRVVVIQATGNVDALDQTAYSNRVVSLTETLDYDVTGALREVPGAVNWEIRLAAGEQVTGPLELFAGKVYFGSFLSTNDTTNACAYGESKIWGVEYLLNESVASQVTPIPQGGLEDTDNPGTYLRHLPPMENQIVMGVTVTQRPTCSTLQEVPESDPYLGTRRYQQVTSANRGEFFLVAQVSGGGAAAVGGSVAEFSRQLPAPLSFTQVQGWAGNID
jgi:type IV pilus assembly protein PilY1